jgi:hypothetical protein
MRMRNLFLSLAALLVAFAAGGAARAEDKAWPCKAQAQALCKWMAPTKTDQCLWHKYAKLDGACKAFYDQRLKDAPCLPDIIDWCPTVAKGPAVGKCLMEYYPILTETCQKKLAPNGPK